MGAEIRAQNDRRANDLAERFGGDDPQGFRERAELRAITSLSEFVEMCTLVMQGSALAGNQRELREAVDDLQDFLRQTVLLLTHPEYLRELLDKEYPADDPPAGS